MQPMNMQEKAAIFAEPEEAEPIADTGNSQLLELLARSGAGKMDAPLIGTLIGIDASGNPLVFFPGNPVAKGIAARTCVALGADRIGHDVVLLFAEGDAQKPIIMGLLQKAKVNPAVDLPGNAPAALQQIQVDGERLLISAEREIVLRCGEASITLTREGKVLLRGTYLSSRSSGVNRIKGGSVDIN